MNTDFPCARLRLFEQTSTAPFSCVCTTSGIFTFTPPARCVLYYVQNHLAKGSVPPPVGYPLRMVHPGIEPGHTIATFGRCITSLPALALPIRAGRAERSCSPYAPMTKGANLAPLEPIRQRGDFRSPPCIPQRPTLRGLDAR